MIQNEGLPIVANNESVLVFKDYFNGDILRIGRIQAMPGQIENQISYMSGSTGYVRCMPRFSHLAPNDPSTREPSGGNLLPGSVW